MQDGDRKNLYYVDCFYKYTFQCRYCNDFFAWNADMCYCHCTKHMWLCHVHGCRCIICNWTVFFRMDKDYYLRNPGTGFFVYCVDISFSRTFLLCDIHGRIHQATQHLTKICIYGHNYFFVFVSSSIDELHMPKKCICNFNVMLVWPNLVPRRVSYEHKILGSNPSISTRIWILVSLGETICDCEIFLTSGSLCGDKVMMGHGGFMSVNSRDVEACEVEEEIWLFMDSIISIFCWDVNDLNVWIWGDFEKVFVLTDL